MMCSRADFSNSRTRAHVLSSILYVSCVDEEQMSVYRVNGRVLSMPARAMHRKRERRIARCLCVAIVSKDKYREK